MRYGAPRRTEFSGPTIARAYGRRRCYWVEIAPAAKLGQGLLESTWRKLLKRTLTLPGGVAAGYASSSNGPNSAVELPPKVLSVPGMFAPPSCQVHAVSPPLVL